MGRSCAVTLLDEPCKAPKKQPRSEASRARRSSQPTWTLSTYQTHARPRLWEAMKPKPCPDCGTQQLADDLVNANYPRERAWTHFCPKYDARITRFTPKPWPVRWWIDLWNWWLNLLHPVFAAHEHCLCDWGPEASESDLPERDADWKKQDANSEALAQGQSAPPRATQVQAPSHALTAQCGGSAIKATDNGRALGSAAESVEDAISAIDSEWEEAVCRRLPLEANHLTLDCKRGEDGSVVWYIGVDGCYVNGREHPPMWCSIYVANPSDWDTNSRRAAIRAKIEEQAAWFTSFYR